MLAVREDLSPSPDSAAFVTPPSTPARSLDIFATPTASTSDLGLRTPDESFSLDEARLRYELNARNTTESDDSHGSSCSDASTARLGAQIFYRPASTIVAPKPSTIDTTQIQTQNQNKSPITPHTGSPDFVDQLRTRFKDGLPTNALEERALGSWRDSAHELPFGLMHHNVPVHPPFSPEPRPIDTLPSEPSWKFWRSNSRPSSPHQRMFYEEFDAAERGQHDSHFFDPSTLPSPPTTPPPKRISGQSWSQALARAAEAPFAFSPPTSTKRLTTSTLTAPSLASFTVSNPSHLSLTSTLLRQRPESSQTLALSIPSTNGSTSNLLASPKTAYSTLPRVHFREQRLGEGADEPASPTLSIRRPSPIPTGRSSMEPLAPFHSSSNPPSPTPSPGPMSAFTLTTPSGDIITSPPFAPTTPKTVRIVSRPVSIEVPRSSPADPSPSLTTVSNPSPRFSPEPHLAPPHDTFSSRISNFSSTIDRLPPAKTLFWLGFILGPWCWLYAGWVLSREGFTVPVDREGKAFPQTTVMTMLKPKPKTHRQHMTAHSLSSSRNNSGLTPPKRDTRAATPSTPSPLQRTKSELRRSFGKEKEKETEEEVEAGVNTSYSDVADPFRSTYELPLSPSPMPPHLRTITPGAHSQSHSTHDQSATTHSHPHEKTDDLKSSTSSKNMLSSSVGSASSWMMRGTRGSARQQQRREKERYVLHDPRDGSVWVQRCRVAAYTSGIAITGVFVVAVFAAFHGGL